MEVNPLSIILVISDSKGDRLLFRYPFTTDVNKEVDKQWGGKKNPYSLQIVEDLLQTPQRQTSNIYSGKLTGFTDEVLSTLFAVKPELCNRKFELKVNDVRFVGHPTLLPFRANKDDGTSSMILINIVFAMQACANHSIVKCYYDLSKRLGKALRHEEKRCSYLSDEMKIMVSAHDEIPAMDSDAGGNENDEEDDTLSGNGAGHLYCRTSRGSRSSLTAQVCSPFELILQRSSLAASLKTVYEELSSSGVVQVRINKWVLVSFCLPHKAHQIHNRGLLIEPETIEMCLQSLRPYHGMLLLVDPNELLESMPLDCSPSLIRLIKLYSPLKSLQMIAIEVDLTLGQVFQLTGHLVYWAKATIIYPLCESNVYVVASGANLHTDSPLAERFSKDFAGLCLLQVLSEFSIPAPLWYHARCGTVAGCTPMLNGVGIISQNGGSVTGVNGSGSNGNGGIGAVAKLARVTAWLLQRRLLMQLHTYIRFMPTKHGPPYFTTKDYSCEKHKVYRKNHTDSTTSKTPNGTSTENIDVVDAVAFEDTTTQAEYPTENHLNQTNFSHIRPIVIESEKRKRTSDDFSDDAENTSPVDVVPNVISSSFDEGVDEVGFSKDMRLNGDAETDRNRNLLSSIELNVESNMELSIDKADDCDSGYEGQKVANIDMEITTTNTCDSNETDDDSKTCNEAVSMNTELPLQSTGDRPISVSPDEDVNSISAKFNDFVVSREDFAAVDKQEGDTNVMKTPIATDKKKSEKSQLSPNFKMQAEMSFQPPTVVSSMLAHNASCDVVDSCFNKVNGIQADQLSEENLLADFTDEEREALFKIPAAHNPEDLTLMAQLNKKGYFKGDQHLEEIMFMENLTRSQILQLLDKFREVLITYETEDPAIAMLYSNH